MGRLAQNGCRAGADPLGFDLEDGEVVDAAGGAAAPALQPRGVARVQSAGARIDLGVEACDGGERSIVAQSSAPSEPGARQIVCGSR